MADGGDEEKAKGDLKYVTNQPYDLEMKLSEGEEEEASLRDYR